jgi:prephenate dehydratase
MCFFGFAQLLAHDLHIVGEVTIPISHCLMVNKGVKLADVKRVASHPVALAPCEVFIKEHGMQKEVAYDTAGSAEMLSKSGDRDSAAIAGKTAAERYGLDIVACARYSG